jgi:hypothetical protein
VSIAAGNARSPIEGLRASVAIFLTLAGLSCGITLLFLGMRAVMDIGGACASGGPYVPSVQCPEGIPAVMMGGVWGGMIFVGLYLWATSKHDVPTLVAFAWPALFLSLGWNFFEYGVDPPLGEGLVWGWLVCAALFALMGGLPLLMMAGPVLGQFTRRGPGTPPARVVVPTRSRVKELRAAQGTGAAPETIVDALERLEALHRSGALSDREFEDAKRAVIRGER